VSSYLPVRLMIWVLAFFLCPIPASLWAQDFQIAVLGRITLAALPPWEPREPASVELTENDLTERVLWYLEKAEKKEIDPWYRDDIRIAWITTKWAQDGVPDWSWHRNSPPHVAATYQVLGCHPDEVWPRIVEQRKAKLGPCYAEIFPDDVKIPKKPSASVTISAVERKRA